MNTQVAANASSTATKPAHTPSAGTMHTSQSFRLIYGNRRPSMLGERSMWVKARDAAHAVVIVCGSCSECDGYSFKAGKIFGTIETK